MGFDIRSTKIDRQKIDQRRSGPSGAWTGPTQDRNHAHRPGRQL